MQAFPVARLRQHFNPAFGFAGRQALPVKRSVSLGMTKEEALKQKKLILDAAAAALIDGADKVSANMDMVYDNYQRFGAKAWLRCIAAYLVFPPAAIASALAETWRTASDAKKAKMVVMASLTAAQKWINEVTDKFLPVFLDEIEATNPGMAKNIDETFKAVSKKFQRNTDLMKGISESLPVFAGNGVDIFFPELWKQVQTMVDRFKELTLALEALVKAFLGLTESALTAAKVAPYFVLGGVAIIAIWLLVK